MARVKERREEDISERLAEAADKQLRDAGLRGPSTRHRLLSQELRKKLQHRKAQLKPKMDRRMKARLRELEIE